MIRKRYILIPLFVLFIGVLVIGVLRYILFSRNADDTEVVFAATEVGAPIGPATTKNIGTEGGTLTSPDGRFTLTVPQNALTETIPFSIQPITNKAEQGLGLGYRLEPDGKTFTTPLEISFRYDDGDLEGTIPEALAIGYQDNAGAWHVQRGIAMDKDTKTITLYAEHFTDYTLDYTLKLSPSKATIHVGESVTLDPSVCDKNLIDEFKERFFGVIEPCKTRYLGGYRLGYQLVGEGQLKEGTLNEQGMEIYTAPAKKPKPNFVIVWLKDKEFDVVTERPCHPWEGAIAGKNDERWVPRKHCYRSVPGPGSVKSEITIVDRAYKVSGNAGGDTVFTGTVCDLEKPFTVKTSNPFIAPFNFTPSSAKGGTWEFATKSGIIGGGSGQYTIEGTDSEPTGIQMIGNSQGSYRGITQQGGGISHLVLTPLTGNECGE